VAYTFYAFLEKIRLDEIVRFTKTPLTPFDPERLEPVLVEGTEESERSAGD